MVLTDEERGALLRGLEAHVAEKSERDGCPILLAIEISSAVQALEGMGLAGEVEIGGVKLALVPVPK